MRKFFTQGYVLCILLFALATTKINAQVNHVVISQVYGGGGNSGAQYLNDFVELFNPTSSAVSVNGWSIQYTSSTSTSWNTNNVSINGTIQPYSYYLIKLASGGAVGVALPSEQALGGINMSATTGKIALVSSTTALSVNICPIAVSGAVVDFVGYGTGANCNEGGTNTAAPSNTTALFRKNNGCTDSDVNGSDFIVAAPNPRNGSSPTNICIVNPSVSTTSATIITSSAALSGGNVSSDGGSPLTDRGVVWNTASSPTIALSTKTSNGTSTGTFSSTLTLLTANTKYFYRAFATNIIGTAYGNESNFTTLPNPPLMGAGSNPSQNGFTANWLAAAGGSELFTYTVEIDDDNAFGSIDVTLNSLSSGATSANITGLASNTFYYYRVKVVNVTGSSSYSATSTGIQTLAPATPILTLASSLSGFGNICINTTTAANSFSINGNYLDGSNINIAALTGFSFSETLNGIYSNTLSFNAGSSISGKTIFIKFSPTLSQSYDGNINISGGGVAGFQVMVTGSGINTLPTAATISSTLAQTSATLNGQVTFVGCSAVTAYGFEYSTVAGFSNGSGIMVTSNNLSGNNFSATISGLSLNVTYYYKAFATNSGGTSYGTQLSFTTSSIVPVVMASQNLFRFTETFSDISNWSNGFVTGAGANHFGPVAINATGSIPSATRVTISSASFSSGTSGGVQKGTGNIQLLATGSTDNSASVAIDFYMDFTGINAGTLSFDWASVNNSTGDRNASLRVYATVDGTNFTLLSLANVLNFTNNVPSSGFVNSVALPAMFNNSSTARLRFYYNNGTGGTIGSRPKISIDNLTVTGVASTPCATPTAGPTSLVFGTVTETTIQGSFTAASPSVNEYLTVISTNSNLTSNPIDGQSYSIGDNIGDGTVIEKGTNLNFTATGLTGATTYNFFVFPVNSICTGGPLYNAALVLSDDATTVAGLPNCAAPANQATNLVFGTTTVNSIQASFTAGSGNEYLVLQSTSPSFNVNPVNGFVYNSGDILGNAKVVQRSSATGFTANGLTPNTTYYYFIISLNSQACLNGPVYNLVNPLSGTKATPPLSPCTTPSAQPTNFASNATSNLISGTFNGISGSGYNYLVVSSTSPALNAVPADNTDYTIGDNIGNGTVIGNSNSSSFAASGLSVSTTYYFFVFSADKNCSGGTKYLTSSPLTGSATTTSTPANNYYYGTLHSHSDYSDGNKDRPGYTPADDYLYASASLGMDFLGISEHNHFSSVDNPGNELANYHLGINQATNFNSTHPNFLAMYGMEWGVISGGGHVVVYGNGMDDLFGWESNVNGTVGPNYDVYVPKNTYTGSTGLFKTVNDYAAKNTFATLAHPNSSDYNNLSNTPYDAVADDAITGTAVESGPATSTNTTYSNPASSFYYLWYYQKLLAKGYHLGPTIDHDNHNTTFGRTTTSRTAVISPSLAKADMVKAIRDMHFYATQDYDAKVDFTINTRIMGSIFSDRNAPAISVNYIDPTNSTSNALIRVMFGIPGSEILPVVVDSVFSNTLSYVDNNLAVNATGYYYIDITNGTTRIVTSPIWYTRVCSISNELTVVACDSYTWNGTTYTSSTTASRQYTTPEGCAATETLHLTINASPVSATISLVGSNTGCPGSGVAFSATTDNGTGGSISSYQWMQNGNTVSTTSTGSFTALSSGSWSVKAFNANNCSVVSNAITATIVDNTAPVPTIANLPVITGECSVTVTPPTATDDCAGTVTGQTNNPSTYSQQGTYNITWTYSDGNGNSSVQTQTVIVKDVTPPTLTLPADIHQSNEAGTCGAIVNYAVQASDNCSAVTLAYSQSSGTTFPVGTTVVSVSATDNAGNTTVNTFNVVITDNQSPTITAPANIVVTNDAGNCSAEVAIGTPLTADNCGVALVSNDYASTTYPVGTTTVTWTVTDINGNSSQATQSVTVVDNQSPTITAPANLVVTNDAGNCSAVVNIGTTVTADNCGVASVSNDHASTTYQVGTTTVTWTVTDIHGNSSQATQTVIVIDNQSPTIIAPANLVVNNDAGNCSAVVNIGTPVTTDNCGVASVTNDHASTTYPVGTTTVTWMVTDIHGNSSIATQTVTVTDNELPTVITRPVTITLVNGTASVTTAMINNGSSDNCGISSIYLAPRTYTCADIGNQTVTLVVTDIHGNVSTGTAIVTVVGTIPTLSISSVPTNNTYTGGISTNLYLGYGAQSTVLQVNAPGEGAPYTNVWTGNYLSLLSSTTSGTPVFTPSLPGSYTYNVKATNKYGCSTNSTITICVTDIRVAGTNGSKVYVCHMPPGNPGNRQTLSISVNAVSAHITGHEGDRLGTCEQTPCSGNNASTVAGTSNSLKTTSEATNTASSGEDLKVTVMPNPSTTFFTLKLESKYATPVNMRVMDASGRVVDAKSQIESNSTIQIGQNYSSGTYFAEMIQGAQRKIVRLVKGKS